ncbi:integrase [Ectopseudomonas mendocina]|uniref:integrase n=1 Tax=Ectopseudomonas mendocina TaxID=300 RepID=UPI003F08532D
MSEALVFQTKAELSASANLKSFIESCRTKLTIFGAELLFDEGSWDVTDSIKLKGRGNERTRLIFSNFSSVNDKTPALMAEPFLSFSKAYIRYMHGLKPTKSIAPRLTALRAVEAALTEHGNAADPIKIDLLIINRAAQLIAENYAKTTAYRIGGQLEMLADFLFENQLAALYGRWKSFICRPSDSVRVGKEFDQRREQKMPSTAALDALPKVFFLATQPADVLFSSIAALLCSAPDRINEVLLLPERCETPSPEEWELSEETYGLRWWSSKGAEPTIKWIAPTMVTVVKEAIRKIRSITAEARHIAKWYEEHPGQLFLAKGLEGLRGRKHLSMSEVAEVVGLTSSESALQLCQKTLGIGTFGRGRNSVVEFSALEMAVVKLLPKGFPYLNEELGLKYSEALFVVRTNEMHAQRGTYRCMIEGVSINQVNTAFGTRVEHGFPSVFTRLGFFESDGGVIKMTTHKFRHYLNTLAQAGGLSQLDIAKWSSRVDVRQNVYYDHVTPDQMLCKIREAVGNESLMFGPLAEIPKKVLIPRDEFSRLRIPTAHTTDFGYCVHDYTMSPCELHRDCIHCEDLVCLKGDEKKALRLHQGLVEARELLRQAEQAVGTEYAGSDRWLIHHRSTVDRLSQLCAVLDDPRIPAGAMVQLAQAGRTQEIHHGDRSTEAIVTINLSPEPMLAGVARIVEE